MIKSPQKHAAFDRKGYYRETIKVMPAKHFSMLLNPMWEVDSIH
jgi:hypothetical protein